MLLIAVSVAFVTAAQAQVSLGGSLGYLDRRLTVLGAVEHQAGMVGGVEVVLSANVLRLSLSGGGGKLSAKTAVTPEVDYGRAAGEIAVVPVPWFALCGGVGMSAFVSDIGTQRWILPRIGAEVRPAFASIPAEAYARGAVIVGATTNSPVSSSGGLSLQGGLLVSLGRLQVFVDYQLERLNFDAGDRREEQRGEIASGFRFRF
jgi:hypothetical protein